MTMKSEFQNLFDFDTKRLKIASWRDRYRDLDQLSEAIVHLMDKDVMATLPPSWNNVDTPKKREEWILEREDESLCLAALSKDDHAIIGLVFLSKPKEDEKNVEVRIGYLISKNYWGCGYATEIVGGLCALCSGENKIAQLIAGVDTNNIASVKALTKNGFYMAKREINGTEFYQFEPNHCDHVS